jgi:hypothetical protein
MAVQSIGVLRNRPIASSAYAGASLAAGRFPRERRGRRAETAACLQSGNVVVAQRVFGNAGAWTWPMQRGKSARSARA